jgi:hypothetical protein
MQRRTLRSFAFRVKEVNEILHLVRLQNISEGGHRRATVVDLMLDFLFAEAFADGAQIWPEFPASAVCAMAVLASLFVKERGSGLLAFV